jgi:excisionase family DNA binding protein
MKPTIERPDHHGPAATSNVTHLFGHPSTLDNRIAQARYYVANPLSRPKESFESIIDECDALVANLTPAPPALVLLTSPPSTGAVEECDVVSKPIATSASPDDLPETFGVAEVAQFLGIGIDAVYDLVRQKAIVAVKPGRRWIISRMALKRYMSGYDRSSEAGPIAGTAARARIKSRIDKIIDLLGEIRAELSSEERC